jgi:hypothetical protein
MDLAGFNTFMQNVSKCIHFHLIQPGFGFFALARRRQAPGAKNQNQAVLFQTVVPSTVAFPHAPEDRQHGTGYRMTGIARQHPSLNHPLIMAPKIIVFMTYCAHGCSQNHVFKPFIAGPVQFQFAGLIPTPLILAAGVADQANSAILPQFRLRLEPIRRIQIGQQGD